MNVGSEIGSDLRGPDEDIAPTLLDWNLRGTRRKGRWWSFVVALCSFVKEKFDYNDNLHFQLQLKINDIRVWYFSNAMYWTQNFYQVLLEDVVKKIPIFEPLNADKSGANVKILLLNKIALDFVGEYLQTTWLPPT